MAELKDVIAYILENYPHKSELSNARVTKMIYLADWRHAITFGSQISSISWYFNNYGPFVWDIKNTVDLNPRLFEISETLNSYGDPKVLFILRDTDYVPRLSDNEQKSVDHVIGKTSPLTWEKFIKLVYSTYPIASSEKYTYLDLVGKSREYLKDFQH